MEIEVLTRSKQLREILPKIAKFYAKKLNIENSKYKVYICTDSSLREDGNNGLCAKTGDHRITVALYSRLKIPQLIHTLAHEMVHVKQICRGQYKSIENKRGNGFRHYWLGKRVSTDYLQRPWEIEAFKRESILAESFIEYVQRKIKRNKLDKK